MAATKGTTIHQKRRDRQANNNKKKKIQALKSEKKFSAPN